MKDKIVLVTGGNSGIGYETAKQLAEKGAKVVIVSRSREKGEAAVAKIKASVSQAKIDLLVCDLGSFVQVQALAKVFQEHYDRLDVLVLNAGVFKDTKELTQDGLESVFQTNHFSQFLLTLLLLKTLQKTPSARLVIVSSDLHKQAKEKDMPALHDDFTGKDIQSFSGMRAYAQSKLMNIWFANHFTKLAKEWDITANSLHPGVVSTGIGQDGDTSGLLSFAFRIFNWFTLSPEKGAQTSVYLASSETVAQTSGKYFVKCKEKPVSSVASNEEYAQICWDKSLEVVKPYLPENFSL